MRNLVAIALAALVMPGLAVAKPLKVVGPWEIAGVDPAQSGFVFSRMQVAETLVSVDVGGKLTAGLATSWPAARTASPGGSGCARAPASMTAPW